MLNPIEYITKNYPEQIKYCLETLKSWNNKTVSFLNDGAQDKNVSLIKYVAVASLVYAATCYLWGSEEKNEGKVTWQDGVRVLGKSAAMGIALWGALEWLDPSK